MQRGKKERLGRPKRDRRGNGTASRIKKGEDKRKMEEKTSLKIRDYFSHQLQTTAMPIRNNRANGIALQTDAFVVCITTRNQNVLRE